MEPFVTHTGRAVPLRRSNVDTDQIIPAVYLKRVTRDGFEDGLFAAWRAGCLDVQPQLRGPPGQGRAHPPGLAGSRRRHRRDRPPGRTR